MKSGLIIGTITVILIIGGAFAYITRPVSAPSQPIENASREASQEALNSNEQATAPVDPAPAAGTTTYAITQSNSQASFQAHEVLRGEAFTAVGTTNQVAGTITLTGTDITTAQFNTVTVNARTLKTDSAQRDGAIARLILKSETAEGEFITFEPTNTTPTAITGNLTILDTTRPVTFTGLMENASPEQITGSFVATINYSDFGLTIPEVAFVAGVEENVLLQIDFTAQAI